MHAWMYVTVPHAAAIVDILVWLCWPGFAGRHVCVYVCMYVYMYVFLYAHTHTSFTDTISKSSADVRTTTSVYSSDKNASEFRSASVTVTLRDCPGMKGLLGLDSDTDPCMVARVTDEDVCQPFRTSV
jgi:hypothetical protein